MPPSTKRLSSTGKVIKRPVGRPATASKPGAAKSGRTGRVATGLPKQSKDDLRARVEKLERANTMLRLKNRTMQAAVHEANDRVAELEEEVSQLQRHPTATTDATPRRPRSKAPSIDADAKPVARGRRGAPTRRSSNHLGEKGAADQDDAADRASS